MVHFHCGGVNEAGYRRLGDRKLSWRCSRCKQVGNTMPSSPRSPLSTPDSVVLQEIRALSMKFTALESMKEDIVALKYEFAEFKTSITNQYNEVIKEITGKISNLELRLAEIEKVQSQVAQLQIRLDGLEEDQNNKDQWSRINNIEIKGVPQTSNENLFDIVTKISAKVNYPISKNHINFITRVPTSEKDRIKPIIVCFCQRYVKEDFVAAARHEMKTSIITPAKIGLNGNQKIFVNDHLTIRNKMLLSKTKRSAAEAGFRYVWVKNTKIYARKDDTSPIVIIKTEKDLKKII